MLKKKSNKGQKFSYRQIRFFVIIKQIQKKSVFKYKETKFIVIKNNLKPPVTKGFSRNNQSPEVKGLHGLVNV